MSTRLRTELSKDNKYYIPKHRRLELKHFVQQYPDWVKALREIDGLAKQSIGNFRYSTERIDPTSKAAELREYYNDRIKLITDIANETDRTIGIYILQAIINGKSYEQMNATSRLPVCRDVYYELYHKFFFLLDKARR